MEETTALATLEPSLNEQVELAKALAPSDIIPAAYQGKPANIVVAIEFGQSMGLSPAESLYRINVIKGKPTASAELIAAQVRKAGHKLRVSKDEANTSVTCTIVRSDDPKYPFVVTRDKAWAQQMGLAVKENYRKQPLTMLTWRAITACAREACPEALFGVAYTPDEMHDFDSVSEPVSVDGSATVSDVSHPQQEDEQKPQDYLSQVRELFHAYQEARGGIGAAQANGELCDYMRVKSLHELSEDGAATLAEMMQDVVTRYKSQMVEPQQTAESGEPDLAEADYEF
ncbi:hypothetical protein [Parafannyhessea umbonata]|uniref:Uncharacterized protein n=1 Tax=Parafannyhessea umbonata TaxID=604330 RepID=A0A1H1L2N1_9ACTN|nr:hypothetical protein [Parafannyhessea umbonata]SDR68834.1 hypothetical protein SAMN04489857_0651 [Parafannyhessea umbonata]